MSEWVVKPSNIHENKPNELIKEYLTNLDKINGINN